MTSPLPPLYDRWMSELLGGTIPDETRATCTDCAMCGDVAEASSAFNPQTKCCTYLPVLPNFLVGRILEDDDPGGEVGRASVRARIEGGLSLSPLGLGIPSSYGVLYSHGGKRAFGRSQSMRCPHYLEEGGLCGVWRHRNSVCATWFCKHVRGEVGWSFWESIRELLGVIERDLTRWCVLELGFEAAAIARMLPQSPRPGGESMPVGARELDGQSDPQALAQLWGGWSGREVDFYKACAARVAALDVGGVVDVCGPEVGLRIEVVRAAWQRLLSSDIPERLVAAQLVVLRAGRAKERVTTYSPFDPLEMPRELFEVLHHFDGRTTDEARSSIVAAGGPRLSTGLVRKMVDFGVLEPVPERQGEG